MKHLVKTAHHRAVTLDVHIDQASIEFVLFLHQAVSQLFLRGTLLFRHVSLIVADKDRLIQIFARVLVFLEPASQLADGSTITRTPL